MGTCRWVEGGDDVPWNDSLATLESEKVAEGELPKRPEPDLLKEASYVLNHPAVCHLNSAEGFQAALTMVRFSRMSVEQALFVLSNACGMSHSWDADISVYALPPFWLQYHQHQTSNLLPLARCEHGCRHTHRLVHWHIVARKLRQPTQGAVRNKSRQT
jgi:hypothetical protein